MFRKLKDFGGIISQHSVDSCPIMANSMSVISDIESYWYQQKEFSPNEHVSGSSRYMFSSGKVVRAIRLITHFQLVPKSRISGTMPTLPLYEVHRYNCTFHCRLLLKCVYTYMYTQVCWCICIHPYVTIT
jgi:hypothetical protein